MSDAGRVGREEADRETIDQAVRDIIEWMEENHFEATAGSLRPGASEAVLAAVESRLGAPLPLELRLVPGRSGHSAVARAGWRT